MSLVAACGLTAAGLTVAASFASASDTGGETGRTRNRLAAESSPYLLLHADNPVDWYPWGTEAIERAREDERPIFLSIGYSSCYWCHVMERKVFSDPEIARLMNEWFVNVKVDREERPDLDEIYMAATVLLTGHGGWPNSVFLTPDLQPFYAGTYFPPEDTEGRAGFETVLKALHRAWREERPAVFESAASVSRAMESWMATERPSLPEVPGVDQAALSVDALKATYDATWGGFGAAPKFPSPATLALLWEVGLRGDTKAGEMVVSTLRAMGRGGIYDHLAGGFHRYSTDERWLVPHFEKMLYDNALLSELLVRVGHASKDEELLRLARQTLDFVLRDMTRSEGGFKSAINAETQGREGAYYVWTRPEIEAVLDPVAVKLMGPIYGFSGEPNFEEASFVLHLPRPLDEQATSLGIARTELAARLQALREQLLRAREKREHPFVDDKVLTDWNGMMIAAYAVAGRLLEEPSYTAAARRATRFLLANLQDETGVLHHSWRDGSRKHRAFLDDYAYFIRALLELSRTTGEAEWRREALRLARQAEQRLGDPDGGYYLSEARNDLLFRPKSIADGAIPSGNGVMLWNHVELSRDGGEAEARERAERLLRAFGSELERISYAVPSLALGLIRLRDDADCCRTSGGGS